MTRSFKTLLTLMGICTPALLAVSPALAKHPVREIPLHVHVFDYNPPGDTFTWNAANKRTLLRHMEVTVDFANRVYANAGIKFTIESEDEYSRSLTVISSSSPDGDMGCWDSHGRHVQPDDGGNYPSDGFLATALSEDPDLVDGVTVVFPRFVDPIDPAGSEVDDCSVPCDATHKCPPDISTCDPGSHRCIHNGTWYSLPPECYNHDCQFVSTCAAASPNALHGYVWGYPPLASGVWTSSFAHEVGHYLGLQYTFNAYKDPPSPNPGGIAGYRCYDVGQQDFNCGDDTRPTGNPSWCEGEDLGNTNYDPADPTTSCLMADHPGWDGKPAWKNIMAYHQPCQTSYGGKTAWDGNSDERWNSSLTPDQIAIIWHTIATFYDQALTSSTPPQSSSPEMYALGGYDNLFLTGPNNTKEAVGGDSWDTVYLPTYTTVGDANWTKGNVRIYSGDFDGDGVMDAVVSAAGGAHPGTSFYKACTASEPTYSWYPPYVTYTEIPSICYVRTLDANATPGTVIINVGNFAGNGADDVLITNRSGTHQYNGAEGATAALNYAHPTTLPTDWFWWFQPTVTAGNFTGAYQRLDGIANYTQTAGYQYNHREALFDYDDLFVRDSRHQVARLYRADPSGSGFVNNLDYKDVPYNTYSTGWQMDGWSGNLMGDYHDELVLRSANRGLEVVRGQDGPVASFDFFDTYAESGWGQLTSSQVKAWLGDFTSFAWAGWNWGHADLLVSTPAGTASDNLGTRLFIGEPWGLSGIGTFHRSDLTSDVTHVAVGDFIRRGYDDAMFYSSDGSSLYAGVAGGNFTQNVWTGSYPSDDYEWFGRQ